MPNSERWQLFSPVEVRALTSGKFPIIRQSLARLGLHIGGLRELTDALRNSLFLLFCIFEGHLSSLFGVHWRFARGNFHWTVKTPTTWWISDVSDDVQWSAAQNNILWPREGQFPFRWEFIIELFSLFNFLHARVNNETNLKIENWIYRNEITHIKSTNCQLHLSCHREPTPNSYKLSH